MPTQSIRRAAAAKSRRPWFLAVMATLLTASALAPNAFAAGHKTSGRSVLDGVTGALKGGKVVPPKDGTWVGTYQEATGPQVVKQNRVLGLEDLLGRPEDVDHIYEAWNAPFPGWREDWDNLNGRVPFVSWAKASSSAINSGRYDGMIKQRALDVKAAGYPILLEYFWEMDGARNKHVAGSPAQFIAAWKRIHDIFARIGVTNVSWVWCPNAWGYATGDAQKYYPGDNYVDWLCANGYNWAPGRKGDEWRSFQWTFQPFYDWGSTKNKPLMIGEFGVQERKPGEKAQWLKDAATTLKNDMPDIKAVVYFDVKKKYNWSLDSSSASANAFKSLAKTLGGG